MLWHFYREAFETSTLAASKNFVAENVLEEIKLHGKTIIPLSKGDMEFIGGGAGPIDGGPVDDGPFGNW